jgi:hypothetical protein
MSSIQKFILAVLPDSWAKSMEAESREWIYICSCGHTCSVWDMGGIRGKAAGNPRRRLKCPGWSQWTWHVVSRRAVQADDPQA